MRILTVAPVRVGNLAGVRIGGNLIRPAGPNGRYWLVFPEHEVKNRVPLEFELDDGTTAMIDRDRYALRPSLMRGQSSDRLFPGENGGPQTGEHSFPTDQQSRLRGDRGADHGPSVPARGLPPFS